MTDTVIREQCGTHAGYQMHKKNGEQACPDCLSANKLYRRMHRFRSRAGLWRCHECGSVFDEHRCTINNSQLLRAEL